MRLRRTGRTHDPSYRIIIIDSRRKRDGRETESIGWYDPTMADETKQLKLDAERAKYWLSVGAQPTLTVKNLLKRVGIGKAAPKAE
jgi:small subunit ribosomal protein S16